MITTAAGSSWISDTPLTDLVSAGLRAPCVVRLKLFTLENGLLERRLGALGPTDLNAVRQALSTALEG